MKDVFHEDKGLGPRKTLIESVATKHALSKADADRIISIVFDAIANEVVDKGRFHIAEIGSITAQCRAPRPYFNPRTKQEEVSKGTVSLKISISKKMRRLFRLK